MTIAKFKTFIYNKILTRFAKLYFDHIGNILIKKSCGIKSSNISLYI